MTTKSSVPGISVCLSPLMLHLYDVHNSIVVIIDVLRATSTIASALSNGAKSVIPVDSVAECIKLGKQMDVITAGERDGKIAEGLTYGNSPLQYSKKFISGKTLVLTTTNGTRLLHMALSAGANSIITGAFCNIGSVCSYLAGEKKNVVLACAGWKDRINIEDTLFAGAVCAYLENDMPLLSDSAKISRALFDAAGGNLFDFMRIQGASHYHRLMGYDLEDDIRFALTENNADVLCLYEGGRLIKATL